MTEQLLSLGPRVLKERDCQSPMSRGFDKKARSERQLLLQENSTGIAVHVLNLHSNWA